MAASRPVPGRRARHPRHDLTDDGFAKLASAAPGHVEAVRAYVIDALDEEQLGQLNRIGDVILGRLDGDTARRQGAQSRS